MAWAMICNASAIEFWHFWPKHGSWQVLTIFISIVGPPVSNTACTVSCDWLNIAFVPQCTQVGTTWATVCNTSANEFWRFLTEIWIMTSLSAFFQEWWWSKMAVHHSIYFKTVSYWPLLSALLHWFKLVYKCRLGQSNMHRALDFCQDQSGRNQMYPIAKE